MVIIASQLQEILHVFMPKALGKFLKITDFEWDNFLFLTFLDFYALLLKIIFFNWKCNMKQENRQICLTLDAENYDEIFKDPLQYQLLIDEMIIWYPELFPPNIMNIEA